ncbi:MAG: sporulation integral membrane protein YtvI [Alicyclobacillaceae bacterium]|nr:sporulation integral membrane protein YtvI [Alicyclobacillaceae bacterium]
MPSSTARQVKLRRYLWRLVEVVSLLLFVVLLLWVFSWSLRYILPFVLGWLIALLLWPLVRALERRGLGRIAAVTAVMTFVVAAVLLLSVYAVVALVREASAFSTHIAQYASALDDLVREQITAGQQVFGELPPKVSAGIEDALLSSLGSMEAMLRGFARSLVGSLTHLPETVFVIVISLVAAFLMLVRRERMYASFLRILPPGWAGKVEVVAADVTRAFVGTIRVQVVLMLLSAVLGVIGMWIIGIEYFVMLGILFGLAGMVPIVGSALITVPWAVGAALMGDIPLAVKVLLLQIIISIIRHLVEPKILADNVGLDMLSTLFGLYVGLKVLGVIGLFLGPILLIGIKSLLRARMFVDFLPVEELDSADGANVGDST